MESRQRLTITLKRDLLPQLDAIIDGEKIRNRSHAIEYLLMQGLRPKMKRAFILAGGQGLKMRPFTYEMPKTMIPVRGKPILEHTIEMLRKQEVREVYIVIGYLGDKIKNYFGDGARFGLKISYIEEKRDVGTGRILKQLKQYVGRDPFLLVYGDVLADIDLQDFMSFHLSQGDVATVALTSIKNPENYGVVNLKGNKVVGFTEKPKGGKRLSHLISAGFFVFTPDVFEYIPAQHKSNIEEDILIKLASLRKLSGYPFSGQWFDVSTPEIYEQVIKEWKA